MLPVCGHMDGTSRFVGTFKDLNSAAEIVTATDEKGLYLGDERPTRSMHHGGNTFSVNGLWLQLSFEDECREGFQRLRISGNLRDSSPVWVD